MPPEIGLHISVSPRFQLRNCREKRYKRSAASADECDGGLLAAGASAQFLATNAPLTRIAILSVRKFDFPLLTTIKARLLGLWHVQETAAKDRCHCEHSRVECFVKNGKHACQKCHQDETVDHCHLKTEQAPIKDFAFNCCCAQAGRWLVHLRHLGVTASTCAGYV